MTKIKNFNVQARNLPIIVRYPIVTSKVQPGKKIILITDLHDLSNIKDVLQFIKNVNDVNSDCICIAGDIMQGSKYNSSEKVDELGYVLCGLAEAQPVILSFGNHDLKGITAEGRRNFQRLSQYRDGMIYPLDNESMTMDGIRFTGYTAPDNAPGDPVRGNAYDIMSQNTGKADRIFAEGFKGSGLNIPSNSKEYEILVGHAPHPLSNPKTIQIAPDLANFDMALTGHLHNGYLSARSMIDNPEKHMGRGWWEAAFNKYGPIILFDKSFGFTDHCRGVEYVGHNGVDILQLCNNKFFRRHENGTYVDISREDAIERIRNLGLRAIVISGGVNKYFGFAIENPEITLIEFSDTLEKSSAYSKRI